MLAGCGTTPGVQTVVDDRIAGHALLVQIEASESGAWGPYAHPVAGGEAGAEALAGRLDGLLGELAYARPKGKKVHPLMAVEDRQRLAAALAEGLSTAAPDERVRFVLSVTDDAHTPWMTPTKRLTRGVAFVDLEGRFHLAFDLVDDRVAPDELDSPDPTLRAQSWVRLLTETGELEGRGEDGARRLWVAWPLIAPSSSAPPQAPPVEPEPELEPEPEPGPEPETLSQPNASKLELLDELLRDGVIDREEYERRRARLVEPSPSPSETSE